MNCPQCHSARTTTLQHTTELVYVVFRCQNCDRIFNARTGTSFNFVEMPTDIVFQVLLYRIRYKLSYRDLAELFLLRSFVFTHETVRDWEERFSPIFADELQNFLILTDSVDIDFNPVHGTAPIQNPATFLHPNRKNKSDAGIFMHVLFENM